MSEISRTGGPFLLLGPLIAVTVGALLFFSGFPKEIIVTAATGTLCALWWVTEPIPIPATSLIPFVSLPLGNVLSHREIAHSYGHSLILLLLGGFMLSTAMERSNAHKRLALGMIRMVGGYGGRRLIFGFMLATAALSMWISNTATVLMLLPVALAAVEQSADKKLTLPLLLGIAYAASIGGLGTPVGTPPNVIFMGIYKETTGNEITFLEWMWIGVPTTLILLPLAWVWLSRGLSSQEKLPLPTLPDWSAAEKRVLAVFITTALLWIFRKEPFGGWSALLGSPEVGDSTVALFGVLLLFVTPNGRGEKLLDWKTASTIPWGILILFGGGLALAKGFKRSGLSALMGDALTEALGFPWIVVILATCLLVTFLTELTSNTATTTLLLPILAAASLGAGHDPRLLMIPATLSASCAFMLPVATAPNAIIFGTERVTVRQMATAGFVLNLLGAVVITALCWWLL